MLGTLAAADPGDDIVASALTSLRSNPWFHVNLTGTEDTGGTTKSFQTDLWWESTGSGTAGALCRIESSTWWNGALTTKTVGDGTVMWAYDSGRNRYTVATYGTFNRSVPTTYVHGAIEAFKATALGPTQYLARMLSDTFGSAAVQYTPWMRSKIAGETSYTDVEPGYVAYDIGNPVYRWIRFTVSQDALGNYQLSGIDLRDVTQVGGSTRTTTWTATIDTTSTPPAGTFVFTAPPGSQPLVGAHS